MLLNQRRDHGPRWAKYTASESIGLQRFRLSVNSGKWWSKRYGCDVTVTSSEGLCWLEIDTKRLNGLADDGLLILLPKSAIFTKPQMEVFNAVRCLPMHRRGHLTHFVDLQL